MQIVSIKCRLFAIAIQLALLGQLIAPVTLMAQSASSAPSQKKTMLYGRIEEIVNQPGAKLPVTLVPMQARYDTSGKGKLQASAEKSLLKGNAQSNGSVSYPVDWRGIWSGYLKIHYSEFAPSRWQFDAQEANRERELTRPGEMGAVSFEFLQQRLGPVSLSPAEVVFTKAGQGERYADAMRNALARQGMPREFIDTTALQQLLRSMPYQYAIHLGDLAHGLGVTGNDVNSRVIRNDVKKIGPKTLEQVVVTYNQVINPTSGKTRWGYSESVLRFTQQSANQLYVQAASVGYDEKGKWSNKIILYGTVKRGQTATDNPFSTLF